MTNRNPYENGVDIPDFVEKKDDDIDMSVFKMADEDANSNNFDFDEEDEYDNEPRRKLSAKGIMVVGGVIIALLLIAALSGWIFGISKSNSLTKLQSEYNALETKITDNDAMITSLNNQITILNAELEKYKTSGGSGSGEATQEGTKYKLEGSINIRDGAGSDKFANYSKLPTEVADELYYDASGSLTTRDGAILPVYETKDVGGNTWGRIADNAWVCLVYQGEAWGTKQ